MATFGGNHFTHFSVPLVYDGRYFMLEPGKPPEMTVFVLVNGAPEFEILKNKPVGTSVSNAVVSAAGIVTVSERASGRFLYKVRPDSETSVAFGRLDGGEIPVKITDRNIQVGGNTVENNVFSGVMAGVVVYPDGGIGIGAPLPKEVLQLLSGGAT